MSWAASCPDQEAWMFTMPALLQDDVLPMCCPILCFKKDCLHRGASRSWPSVTEVCSTPALGTALPDQARRTDGESGFPNKRLQKLEKWSPSVQPCEITRPNSTLRRRQVERNRTQTRSFAAARQIELPAKQLQPLLQAGESVLCLDVVPVDKNFVLERLK